MFRRIEGDLSHWNGLLNSLNSCKTSGYFVSCAKQHLDKEGIALQKIGSLEYFLNRIRISNPQHHPYNQTWVKYPPPPTGIYFNEIPDHFVFAAKSTLHFMCVTKAMVIFSCYPHT